MCRSAQRVSYPELEANLSNPLYWPKLRDIACSRIRHLTSST
jgi:hypothetical protein